MPRKNIVVIGTSAGGVTALKAVAARLPPGLQAAVFTVLHIGQGIDGLSYLPEILEAAGPLPARNPLSGEEIREGRIYVAPPDMHMVLAPGRVNLVRGPKENRTRPAINPLFRSAAASYGSAVTGVILTGELDDGVAGLAEVKRRGGIAVVQDPATARHASLPSNALKSVCVDYVAPLESIGAIIAKLSVTERESMETPESVEKHLVDLTCPECRGPLWKQQQGPITEYRCRVGHAYSPLAMEKEHECTVERTLWSAIVALEEAAEIEEMLAPSLGPAASEKARAKREQAEVLREMLNGQT